MFMRTNMQYDQHMPDLDPNALVALEALLSARSVTVAAKKLGVSQSAMSHRLKTLRELLDDPLLAGGRNGFVLTPRAEAMEAPLRAALADLRAAVRVAEPFDAKRSQRRFVVAANDYGELVALRTLLTRLANEAPKVALAIEPLSTGVEQRLASGAVDVAVTVAGTLAPSLKQKVIARDVYAVAMRKGHPALRGKRRLSLEAYASLHHLQVAPFGLPGSAVDRELAALGLSRHVSIRVASFVSAPLLLAESDLVATLGTLLLQAASKYVDLDVVVPPLPLPKTEIVMLWHERSQSDSGHTWLRGLIADSMRNQPRSHISIRS